MPLNGSGSYSAPASTWNPAVTSTTINSTDWAALLADITTALSTAMYKDGQATPTANIPMGGFKFTGLAAGNAAGNSLRYEQLFTTSAVALLGAMDWVKGADVASATTTNLTTATGNAVHVTGTTTITTVTLGSGLWRLVIFDGALTLTHHATNNNLPGGANITTAAGDRALYWSDGTTVYCVSYTSAAVNANTFFTTGDVKLTIKTTADTGWLLMNDTTIGDASSGATGRANADTSALFTLLWANTADADCAVSTGRGATAAADFAAHKTIALPKSLGRSLAVYGAGSGLTSRALAHVVGEETHQLTSTEMPSHTHAVPTHASDILNGGGSGLQTTSGNSGTSGSAGSDGAHNNMQPTVFLNVMVKL